MSTDAASFIGNIPQHYDKAPGRSSSSTMPRILPGGSLPRPSGYWRRQPARASSRGGCETSCRRRALTATDLNPPMLDVACSKIQPSDQVAFQPADAIALPFADRSFDAVVCQFGVMFFPDKAKILSRGASRAEAGRPLSLQRLGLPSYNPFARIAGEIVERFFPADPPQFYTVPFSCHQIDPIKEALIAAGFADIFNAVSGGAGAPDAAQFARGVVFGNPLIDQVRARGGVDPERIVEALAEEFRREFGGNPGRMPIQAIVFSAARR